MEERAQEVSGWEKEKIILIKQNNLSRQEAHSYKSKFILFVSNLAKNLKPSLIKHMPDIEKLDDTEVLGDIDQIQNKLLFESSELSLTVDRLRKENTRLSTDLDAASALPRPPSPATIQAERVEAVELERKRCEAEMAAMELKLTAKFNHENNELNKKLSERTNRLDLAIKDIEEKEWRLSQVEAKSKYAEGKKDEFSDMLSEMEVKHQQMQAELGSLRAVGKEKLEKANDSNAELSKVISIKQDKIVQLQREIVVLKDKEKSVGVLNSREKKQFAAVQQRLQQLVTVHRTLLRRYATLELEIAESRHKLSLRDERIKQLESNARARNANMRMQAALHINEISRLRQAHAREVEALKIRTSSPRSQQRLSQHIIKPIRGGTRKSRDTIQAPPLPPHL